MIKEKYLDVSIMKIHGRNGLAKHIFSQSLFVIYRVEC